MIHLITGMPGNGKSLRAVWWLISQIHIDNAAVKAGAPPREFYTDIEGFDVDAVERLTGRRVLPAPDDWRDAPNGSVLVYDEAHRRFPSTGRPGRSDDPVIRDMDTHRHGGYDIVLITQWPTKIHHEVRSLIGNHVHMNRSMGLEAAGVLTWSRVQIDPYDERQREKAEEEIWRFPRDMYPLYKSATLHTVSHKFRLPKKFWGVLSTFVMLLIVLWLGYVFFVPDRDAVAASPQAAAKSESANALALPPQPPVSGVPDESLSPGAGAFVELNTRPVTGLAGCVASDRGCRCFAVSGDQIDMDRRQCERVISQPLPFNVYHQYGGASSAPVPDRVTASGAASPVPGTSPASPGASNAAGAVFGDIHAYGAFELPATPDR